MNVHVVAQRSAHGGSRRAFWWHFLEMVGVMLLSMAIFGAAVSGVFAILGHGSLLHFTALRGLLMSVYMVVGMSLWMRHRQDAWASVLEMSAAMIVPYVLLVGPFAASLLAKGTFLGAMHVLMLPCMYLAMIHRREEYEQGHARHTGGRHPGGRALSEAWGEPSTDSVIPREIGEGPRDRKVLHRTGLRSPGSPAAGADTVVER